MCLHVSPQTRFGEESFLTDVTSFVSDVQVNPVPVVGQCIPRLCTEPASRVAADKRLFVSVDMLLVFCDTCRPRGSKSASRMIA